MKMAFRRKVEEIYQNSIQGQPNDLDKAFERAKIGKLTLDDRNWFKRICSRFQDNLEGPFSIDEIPALIGWLKALGYLTSLYCYEPFNPTPLEAQKLEILCEVAAKLIVDASEREYYAPKKKAVEMTEEHTCGKKDCPNYCVNCFYNPENGGFLRSCFTGKSPSRDQCMNCCSCYLCDRGQEILGYKQSDTESSFEPAEFKCYVRKGFGQAILRDRLAWSLRTNELNKTQ
jgi:hypothetical protein